MKNFYRTLLLFLVIAFSNFTVHAALHLADFSKANIFSYEQQPTDDSPIVYGPSNTKEFEKVTLIWEGELKSSENWVIYSGKCEGILLGTTKKNKFEVTPSATQDTFYVRAENNTGNSKPCGSFKFNFTTSTQDAFNYNEYSYSKNGNNPFPTTNTSQGVFKSESPDISIDAATGEVDLKNSSPGIYTIYFFPSNSQLGYKTTLLEIQNTAVLTIATTNQAAEDLTDGIFTITASAAPAVDILVNLSVTGTATAGSDYVTIANSFVFPAGQTTFDIVADVIPDSALEGTETIIMTLLSTNNTDVTIGTPGSSTMNLIDNDSASINISDASGNEDDGAITINATLNNAVQGGFSVDFSSIDASATVADNDYTAIVNQTITFAGTSGESQTITLIPTADLLLENDETLIITMSNLTGTSLPVNITDSSIVTILNDEVDCSNAAAVVGNFQSYDSGCLNGASGAASAILFYEGFENAVSTPNEYRNSVNPIPGLPQWRYEGAPSVNARLSVFSNGQINRANNGAFGLGLDEGNFIPHSIILNIDLSQEIGSDDLRFSYASYNSNDENTPEDMISIRGDVTDPWVDLSDWNDGIRTQWITREADIDAVLAAAGQSVSANTEIRFTQSDNFPFGTDGVVFDDIMIFKEGYTYLWNNNETTGVIQDLQPGTYSVTITSAEGCTTVLNGTVGGSVADDSSFSYANSNYCQNDPSITPTITGLTGGFFSTLDFGLDLNPITGEVNISNSFPGRSYTITYQTNGTCPSTTDQVITIDFLEDSSFGYGANSFTIADPIQFPTIVLNPGGTYTSTPAGLDLNPNTGAFNPANSTIGSYGVEYTTGGNCPSSFTQQIDITFVDNTNPIALCQPFIGQIDANGILVVQVSDIDAGSTDNQGIASLALSQDTFTCADIGVNNVTLTVTDTSGNTATCTTTVTVEDVDAPVIQCANVTLELDANGQASLNNGSFTSDDNYDVFSTALNIEPIPSATVVPLGDDQVRTNLPIGFDFTFFGTTYSNFDISSNGFIGFGGSSQSGCCSGGNLLSGFTNPNNLIALAWTDLNPGRQNNISFQTIGAAPNRRLVVEFNNVNFFGGGSTVTGQIQLFENGNRIEIHNVFNGNIGRTQTQGIVNQGGTIGFPVPGRNATNWNATNDAFAFTPANLFATDNCGSPTVVVSQLDFTCSDLGVNNVTISATDAAGNNSTCNFFVTVVDNELPTPALANLPDVIATCEITSLTPPTVTDNCASTVIITNNASLPITIQGTTVVTWVYNDGNGNFNFQNQNIIINDVIAPVPDVTNLPDIISDCAVTSFTFPTATDNCSSVVTVSNDVSLPISSQGTTVVTWSYDDGNGNSSTQTQNVIINDNLAPTADIANLPDLTAQCEITTLTVPTATDNCSSNIIVTNDVVLPIVSSLSIVWTYDDGNGNSSTQTQNVTINDTAAPVADITTLADVLSNCEVTSLVAPTATDNCSGTVTVTNDASLPITSQGTTVVMWTYTDGNGNSSTQRQNVIVDDIIAPVSDAPNLVDITSDCEITSLTSPTATDNCAGILTGTSNVSLPISTQGTTVITWTYDDGNGNTSTQTQSVIITDSIAPIPDLAALAAITSQCQVTSLTAPSATDNCTGVITGTSDATFPLITGSNTVTWTYDDGNGNTTTQTQDVIVSDTIAPVPDSIVLAPITGQCQITSLVAPTATDNCIGVITGTSDAIFPLTTGTTTVTWTYDDGNGNTNTQTQDVTVSDTIAPVPDVVTLPTINSQCQVSSLAAPTATDNCIGSITATSDAIFPLTTGTTTVIWTYDDGNGNTSSQTQNVVVADSTDPIAIGQDITIDLAGNPSISITAADIDNGSNDNCSAVTITASPDTFTAVGVYTVTLTATDASGNVGTTTVQVTVDDTLSNEDVELANQILIYPNPTSSIVNISTNLDIKSISLYDLNGKLVYSKRKQLDTISLVDLSQGVYLMRIVSSNGRVAIKRVIKN